MIMYYNFQKARTKDFECFWHKEMISIWEHRHVSLESEHYVMCIRIEISHGLVNMYNFFLGGIGV
jgi:hypothetical protein